MTTIDHRDHTTGEVDDTFGVFDFPEPAADDASDLDTADAPDSWRDRAAGLRDRLAADPRYWLKLRKKSAAGNGDTDPDVAPADDDPETAEFIKREGGTSRQRMMTKAMRGGVIACLAAGPIALIVHPGSSDTPPPVSAPTSATDSNAEAAAADLAQAFVPAWLTANRDDSENLARFVDASTAQGVLPQSSLYTATDARLAGITQTRALIGAKTYSVVVSADVAPAGGTGKGVRRYYRVPVAVSENGVRALQLPADTSAPSTGLDVATDYQYEVSTTSPISVAARDFLTSMLTGTGDVERFTSPGTGIGAVTPAPYRTVAVTMVKSDAAVDGVTPRDGQKARIQLVVSQNPVGTSDDSDVVSGEYSLTMTGRAGRWEVSQLDPAPIAKLGGQSDDETNMSGDSTSTGSDDSTDAGSSTGTSDGNSSTTSPRDSSSSSGSGDLIPDATDAPTAPAPKNDDTDANGDSGKPTTSNPAPTTTTPDPLLKDGGLDLGPR